MGSPGHQSSGCSDTPINQHSNETPATPAAEHAIEKQQQHAIALVNQGKLQEAETIYRKLISAGIENHVIYGNLAAILGMQGRLDDRIKLLTKALQLTPNYAIGYYNLGNAFQEKGDLNAAIKSYKTALRFKPNYINAHTNLGDALLRQSNLDEAINSYNSALKLKPNYPEVHNNIGLAFQKRGNLTSAINSYRTALRLKPNYTVVHNNLGIALKETGNLIAAINSYKTALKLQPNYFAAHINLGNALKEHGDLNAASNSYKTALELNPNHPEAHYNLGNVLQDKGELIEAIKSYRAALQIKPNYPEVNYNLGLALHKQGDLTAAIKSYELALQYKPKYPEVNNNLGIALQESGDANGAVNSFRKALQLQPNYPEANWNISLAMLLSGDYKNGWEKYKLRMEFKPETHHPHATPKCRKWDGNLSEKTTTRLLLVSEQGLGDTLQFMRYALELKNKGISVSLCAQSKLHSLIQASGIDSSPLTPEQANQVQAGQWIPLLSVPRILEVRPDNPIITSPYIKTTNQLHIKWAKILSNEQRPIIGINWQGNPNGEKTTGLRGRSLALETFSPIAKNHQISLLSLQKGYGSEQLATCSFKDQFVSCQEQINETWDFLETAAIISNCDLIITCDTSVAHLAGGMGKTTWVTLKKVPEWRWGLEGKKTFWYPSVQLFRQTKRDNWSDVMEQIAQALQERLSSTADR